MTFQKGSDNSTSVGLAGSGAVVSVTGSTQSLLANATVNCDSLEITANRAQQLKSVAADGSGSFLGNSTEVAGSVAVVRMDNTNTSAGITNATVTLAGDSKITANNTSEIVGVAASVILGGKSGFGLGASGNEVNDTTTASVTNSKITQSSGGLTLSGTAAITVVSVAAGLTITRPNASTATSVDLTGMIAVNDIESNNNATFTGGSYTNTSTAGSDGLVLIAEDSPILVSVTGSVSVLGGAVNVGFGAALSDNELTGTNQAGISGTTVTLSGGGISISSASGSPPDGLPSELAEQLPEDSNHAITAVAVSGAGSKNLSIAGSVSLNRMTKSNTASINNSANVTAQGDINITAEDANDIGAGAGSLALSFDSTASSFGAAEVTNKITNTTKALIDTATVTSKKGGISTTTSESSRSVAVAIGGSGATEAALGGSVVVTEFTNTIGASVNNATVTASNTVEISSADTSNIAGSAGAFEGGGKAAIGAAAVGNTLTDAVTATVAGSTVSASAGNIEVVAKTTPQIIDVVVGGSGSGKVAVNGSIAVTKTTLTTTASITGSSANKITAWGTVAVSALEDLPIDSSAGAFGGAGTAAVGLANSDVIANNSTSAFISGGVQAIGRGFGTAFQAPTGNKNSSGTIETESITGVSVTAVSFQDIINVAVGADGAGEAAIAGSATGESLTETTLAYLGAGVAINKPDGTADNSTQEINVYAASTTEMLGLGGSVVGAGTAGIGAGVDVQKITKTTRVYTEDATGASSATILDAEGDIRFRAESTETDRSVSASGGGAGGVTVAGSVSSVSANLTTKATIGQYTQATANGNFQVSANDENKMFILAGTVTGAGNVAIGASVGVPVVNQTTLASIGANAAIDALAKGDALQANTGSFSLNYAPATFDSSAVDTTNDSINLGYSHDFSTGDAVVYNNGGSGSIGGLTSGTTYYVIVVNATTIKLAASADNADAGTAIDFTSGGGSSQSIKIYGAPTPIMDSSIAGATAVNSPTTIAANTASVRGVVVTANSSNQISQWVISGSGSGLVAIPLAASVQIVEGTTQAFVDSGAAINQQTGADSTQSVYVTAGSIYSYVGVAGAAGISGAVSVGAGVDVPVVGLTTEAWINEGAKVSATADVVVAAHAQESITSVAVGAGLSGTVGVGGSVTVLTVNNITRAWIGSVDANSSTGTATTVTAGNNVLVNASDDTTIFTVEVGVGVGFAAAGVGISIPVVVVSKDTQAYISNGGQVTGLANGTDSMSVLADTTPTTTFTTKSAQGVAVQATTIEQINTTTTAGGGGVVGFAGAVAVVEVNSTTNAFINDADINSTGDAGANQSVLVGAGNITSLHNLVPVSLSVGAVGVAGAVNVGYVNNFTQGYLGNGANVKARKDVDVFGLSGKDFNSFALSIGAGGVGLSASVAVYTLGAALDSTSQSALTGSNDTSASDTVSSTTQLTDVISSLGGWDTIPNSSDTVATTGTTQTSGNSATVQANLAEAQSSVQASTANNPAADDLDATTAPDNGTGAFIGSGVSVSAGGDLDVQALESVTTSLATGGVTGSLFASVGAAVSVITVNSNTEATVGDNTTLSAAGAITINAALTDNVNATADAITASLGLTLGTQVASITDTSTQYVAINSGAQISQASSLTISASANRTLASTSKDFANIGPVAVGASVATVNAKGSTTATLGGGAQIGQTAGKAVGSLTISAIDSTTATATEFSLSAGIGSASGNGASVNINPTIQAYITDSTTDDPANIAVTGAITITAQATPHADAEALGVAVSVAASIAAVIADASVDATVMSYLGNNTKVSANSLSISGTLSQDSSSDPTVNASAKGGTGGLLLGATGGGGNATISGSVTASTGSSITLPDGNVTIQATNKTSQNAAATGGAAGALAVGAFVTTSTSAVTTSATLGSEANTSTSRTGSLSILASSTNTNTATTNSGSGGLVGVDAADATTSDASNVNATISGGTSTDPSSISASNVIVSAKNLSNYSPTVSSIDAAVVGGSGAVAKNTLTNSTTTTIGDYTSITASGVVQVGAQNQFTEATTGASASAGAGGSFNGTAAKSTSTITGGSTVTFGSGVKIQSGTNPFTNPGGILIGASNFLTSDDLVTLTTGGLIQGAGVTSTIDATLNNTVTLGEKNQLVSSGDLGVGTNTVVDAQTNAEVNTFGVAAVGIATATTTVTSNQNVTVGDNSTLMAFGNVNLTAGNGPVGQNSTIISGSSNAQAYAEGLAGIPTDTATTTLTSNTSLTTNSNDKILSGENVTIGAFSGTPTGTQTGSSQYAVLYIPVTNTSTSDGTVTTTSNVALNGTITAGIFYKLDITIPNGGNTSQVNNDPSVTLQSGDPLYPNPSVTQLISSKDATAPFVPFNVSFDSSWDVSTFTNTLDQQAQKVLSSGVSSNPVAAVMLSNLFASGGAVFVNANSITGNAAITAHVPTISITNNSSDYLLLNGISIPDIVNVGEAVFTGTASHSAAAAAGITFMEEGATQTSSVTISQPSTTPVGNSAFGPALFVIGAIQNTAGKVTITNASGAFAQTSPISAQTISVSAPNGPAIIDTPNATYAPGGQAQDLWNAPGTQHFYPGQVTGGWNTDLAIAAAIDYKFNPNGTSYSYNDFAQVVYAVAAHAPAQSWIYYGFPEPYYPSSDGNGNGSDSKGNAQTWNTQGSDGIIPGTNVYQIGSGGAEDNQGYLPYVLSDRQLSAFSDSNVSTAGSTGMFGSQVLIEANILDINAPITAGPTVNPANINLDQNLGATLNQYRQDYINGIQTNPLFDIPSSYLGNSSITATYNAQTNQITIDSFTLVSTDVEVTLIGQIVSTNAAGNIKLQGSPGQNKIENDTGIALVVEGVVSGSDAVVGKVDIVDKLKNTQTLYVYSPDQSIAVYSGGVNDTLGTGTPTQYISGTSTTYQPPTNTRYRWTETASLTKSLSNNISDDWKFSTTADSSHNPFVQSAGDLYTSTNSNDHLFEENLVATINHYYDYFRQFNSNAKDAYDFGASAQWNFYYPYDITLQLTNSVKADYPIGIDFSGLSAGSLSINSDAAVIFAGKIALVGTTTVNAQGDITQAANATIQTTDLTLSATGAIGTLNQMLNAVLATGGVLTAQAGPQGVFLNLNSAAILSQVTAGNSQEGYGDVVIRATGDLEAPSGQPSGAVNITGKDITLSSQTGGVGSSANPLVLQANSVAAANGGVRGGIVTVSAAQDIGLTQKTGDLLVGRIVSTAGNVTLNAPAGNIYDGRKWTSSGLTLSEAKKIWANLHLTDSTSAQQSVTAFENQVDSNYQQYWQLINNGTVQNGVYTLSDDPVSLYSQQAAASLNVTDPTDAQVKAYAGDLYQQLVTFFNDNLPSDWMSEPDFQTYNPNFHYTATSAQVAALTLHAVRSENQLLYSIDNNILTSTPVIPTEVKPNIVGVTVTLTTGGGIGKNDSPTLIPVTNLQNGTLTPTQNNVVAQATAAGDLLFIQGVNSQGQIVQFAYGQQPADVTATDLVLTVRRPLYVDVGVGGLNVSAKSEVNIAQTAGDLTIGQVTAPSSLVNLTAPGKILNQHTIQGFGNNGTGWTINGNGTDPAISDDVLTLTDGAGGEAHSAWFNTLVPTASFTVSFTYTGTANGGDGIAFVLQKDSRGTSALGGPGGSLGFYGILPSLAYQLNIWSGHTQGANLVTDGTTGTYFDTGSVNVASGHPIAILLSYDASAQTVTVVLTDTMTNDAYTTTYTGINLATLLGSSTAYLGFTGGDGGAVSTQTIRNFNFIAGRAIPLSIVPNFGGDGTGWTLAGNGTDPTISNDVLTLTDGNGGEAHAAWFNTKVRTDSFTASFTYTGTANGGDGIAFVLQNDPRGTTAAGGPGGSLGFYGILPSLAYQLNIWSGHTQGANLVTDGTSGTYFDTGSVDVASGDPIKVVLRYDAAAQTVTVVLTDTKTTDTYTTTYTGINLAQLLGSSTAYLGFTGGDGGAVSTQTISNFTFIAGSVVPQSVITDFGGNGEDWRLNSNATGPTITNNVLTITDGNSGETRSAWFDSLVPTGNFTARFTYTDIGGNGGNGVDFVLQNDPRGTSALGGVGGANGYSNSGGASPITNSVAFQINVYAGTGFTQGINFIKNGQFSSFSSTGNVNVASGHPIRVTLTYDAAAETLIATLIDTTTNDTYTTTYTGINLASILGGSTALIGFTGSTGAAVSTQTISDFFFRPSAPPSNINAYALTLAAGDSVGIAEAPLQVKLGGGQLNVSAQNGVTVSQTAGDLNLGKVSSISGTVDLTAQGSILHQTPNFRIDGFGGIGTDWALNSNGNFPTIANNVLTLTDGSGGEGRSAWFNTLVPTGSFTASFTYTGTADGGDGIAFVLQKDSRGTAAVGGPGGSLGFYGILPSLAYQINIWSGHTQGTNLVTDGTTGTYFDTGSVNVANGDSIKVVLSYDATAHTVTVTLTDIKTNDTYTTVYQNINLAKLLGSSTAYLGFTGGDGGSVSTQTISNFTFVSSSTDPDIVIPEVNVSAPNITLTATTGSVGTADKPLSIILGTGALQVSASTGVSLSQSSGDLTVGQVSSTTGDILLTVATSSQSITTASNTVVLASAGDVTLQAGSNLNLVAGSKVSAPKGTVTLTAGKLTPASTPVQDSTVNLAGSLTATSVSVATGGGNDAVTLADQAGNLSPISFDLGAGTDLLTLQGSTNDDTFVVDGSAVQNNGASRTVNNVEHLDIEAQDGDDTLTVLSTPASLATTLNGQAGDDQFNIGSDPASNNGDLGKVQGSVVVDAGPGSDELFLSDLGAVDSSNTPVPANYTITPTAVERTPLSSNGSSSGENFGGVIYDGSVEKLQLEGSNNVNLFTAQSSADTAYLLNGNSPLESTTNPTGDSLRLITTGISGGSFSMTDLADGTWSAPGVQPVSFQGIVPVADNSSSAQLSGVVFVDFNNDGIQQQNEPGIAGQLVFVDLNGDRKLDNNEPSGFTDQQGVYQIPGVLSSTYNLHLLVQTLIQPTVPTGGTVQVTLQAGVDLKQNFGVRPNSPLLQFPLPPAETPESSTDPDATWLDSVYHTVLGRHADSYGLSYWQARLQAGESRADILKDFFTTAEFLQQELQYFYHHFLGRDLDQQGLAYWQGIMQAGGDESDVVQGILTSAEYQQAHLDDNTFLRSLYQQILGRAGDSEGMTYWQSQLQAGVSRETVVNQFCQSQEAIQEALDAIYASELKRSPDAQGLEVYGQQVQAGTMTLSEVAQAILTSPEYTEQDNAAD